MENTKTPHGEITVNDYIVEISEVTIGLGFLESKAKTNFIFKTEEGFRDSLGINYKNIFDYLKKELDHVETIDLLTSINMIEKEFSDYKIDSQLMVSTERGEVHQREIVIDGLIVVDTLEKLEKLYELLGLMRLSAVVDKEIMMVYRVTKELDLIEHIEEFEQLAEAFFLGNVFSYGIKDIDFVVDELFFSSDLYTNGIIDSAKDLIKQWKDLSDLVTEHNVEQRTEEWHSLRLARIGGSESIGLTTKARIDTLTWKILSEIRTGKSDSKVFVSEAMQRGIDLEPIAKKEYEQSTFDSIEEAGYITNEMFKHIGLSPDGLKRDSHGVIRVGYEFKCPDSKTHLKTIVKNAVPALNLPQLIHYFLVVPTMSMIKFVSFDDRCKGNEMFEIDLYREDYIHHIEKLRTTYETFEKTIDEHVITLNKTI